MNKKVYILLFLCSLYFLKSNAQGIKGTLVDKDQQPIEFATIVLQTTDSTLVNTTYSDSLGHFSFNESLMEFRLIVQHLIYTTYCKEFSTPEVGTIQLDLKDHLLTEVVVKGERPLVKVVNGKMTYDMTQLLQNKMASNAYDALLELPGVYEQNEVLNLAGANGVAVILNGKPSTMTPEQLVLLLKNMPKERVKSAEVMYTAPPQYHVRGAAINLVLTSNLSQAPKLQGQINGEYKQSHYDNYTGGTSLLFSTPTTVTDFMYSFNYLQERSGEDILSHHRYKEDIYNIEQRDRGASRGPIHNIRLGNDFHLNAKNKLSLVYTGQIKPHSESKTKSAGTYSESENRKKSDNPIQMHNIALDYTSGFGLSTGMDYTFFKSYTTQHYSEFMEPKKDEFTAQSKQNIHRISFYADQSHDLGRNWTLYYGTEFNYASDKSAQIYSSLTNKDLTDANTNSKLNEYSYELYGGFSKEFSDRFSLKAYVTGEHYKHKNTDYWSVYPEMELTYIINPNHILQYALGSDKEYPSYWEMINSISHLNGYIEIHGNPNLKPYRTYNMQMSYILKNKYIFTLYGIYENDYFIQLPYQSSNQLKLIYQTTNFDYKRKIGLNVVLPFRVGSWLDSRLTLNGFYDHVKSNKFHDISFSNDNFVGFVMLNNTFNLSTKPNIKAELSGHYISKNIQGPATLSKVYGVTAGVKWTSDNSKMEVRLKVNDLFNSMSPKNLSMNYANQNLNMRILPNNRYVSLSFSYKFGDYKESKRKEIDTSRFGSK